MTFRLPFEKYNLHYPPMSLYKNSKRISEVTEFPTAQTLDLFQQYNYNIVQLKQIARHYHLKQSGNKNVIIKRIVHFLLCQPFSIRIQRCYRKHVLKIINQLHGPAFIHRKMCTNVTDFYTLDNLSDIHIRNFISFTDKDNFTYGFKISSLYDLFMTSNGTMNVLNPYNRNPFPKVMFHRMKRLYYLGQIMNINIQLEEEEENESIQDDTPHKQLLIRTTKLFQHINDLGNYASFEWFLSLNRNELLAYYEELSDVWNFRMMLSNETKHNIYPRGHPFRGISIHDLDNAFLITIQNFLLSIMENMVYYGMNDEFKKLGSFYILGALTMVNRNAAETFPWLYESFQ